jgi:hypothetical protein
MLVRLICELIFSSTAEQETWMRTVISQTMLETDIAFATNYVMHDGVMPSSGAFL